MRNVAIMFTFSPFTDVILPTFLKDFMIKFSLPMPAAVIGSLGIRGYFLNLQIFLTMDLQNFL